MNRAKALALIVFFAAICVYVIHAFATIVPPDVASQHGEGVDSVIHYLFWSTGFIFIVGHLVLITVLIRSTGEKAPEFAPESRKVEWRWAAGAALGMALIAETGVLLLGLPVWSQVYGEPPEDVVHCEVVGLQFNWLVRYPGKDGVFGQCKPELVAEWNPFGLDEDDPNALDDIVVESGQLMLPKGRTARVQLRSHDVIHSFCVTEFRTKQDLIPGFTTHAQFKPTKTGTYEIACAELCGLGHYKMRTIVKVMEPAEFESWLKAQVGYYEDE